jgi:hypothetical protein
VKTKYFVKTKEEPRNFYKNLMRNQQQISRLKQLKAKKKKKM